MAHQRTHFDLPLRFIGTPFEKKVWKAIADVSYGQCASYKDIAQKLSMKAYQAVGQACKKNPFPIIVGCHRIISTSGDIGGYAGGRERKLLLLKLERRDKMKTAVLLANGFEEIEALGVVDILRRADLDVDTVSVNETLEVTSSRGIKVMADKCFEDMDHYDMLIAPGGGGAWVLRDDQRVTDLFKKYFEEDKYVAAICAAPMVLGKAGIVKGKNVTSYPGEEIESYLKEGNYKEDAVVIDGKMITSRGPATAMAFAYALVEILGKDAESLKEGMLYKKYQSA